MTVHIICWFSRLYNGSLSGANPGVSIICASVHMDSHAIAKTEVALIPDLVLTDASGPIGIGQQ